jgi:hypothetical protein
MFWIRMTLEVFKTATLTAMLSKRQQRAMKYARPIPRRTYTNVFTAAP